MFFIFTVPVWVGLILLVLKMLAAGNSVKVPKVAMIRREITAPDGRKAVFEVPANELLSTSIARMYPGGVIPAEATQQTVPEVTHQDTLRLAVSSSESSTQKLSRVEQLLWMLLAVSVAMAFLFGIIRSQSDRGPDTIGALPGHSSYDQGASVSANPAPVSVLPRVQLKTGANVRNGPSRSATVLRVGQQGEVFTKFGEANGWLHVGATQPEGWVAQSVAAPAN